MSARSHLHTSRLATLLLTLLLSLFTATAYADSFEDGLAAYQASEYKAAEQHFKKAIKAEETAAARHNLALAQYKLEQPATAIWQLERAQQLAPYNSSYRYKLSALRQELGLFASSLTWYEIASEALPFKAWIILASISFWTLLAASILPRISGSPVKVAGRVPSPHQGVNGRPVDISIKALRFLSAIALLLALPAILINQQLLNRGIVISNESASLHAAPASAAPQNGTARPGERAQILDQHNEFYQIKTEGNATGWIKKEALRPVGEI